MTDTIDTTSTVNELPLEHGGSVEIHLSSGDLRIRGIDGDRVVVRRRNGEPLGGAVRIEASPGVVRVRDVAATFRLGPLELHTHGSPDLDIDLPRAATVSLRTLSGDIEATGIGGASRWASASGDLRISTSAGPVQVETMSGDATIEASAAIAIGARTVSGDLRVRAPRLEAVDAGTTSGDVRLEADLAEGARHSVSSVSGDVDIVTGSPVRLEAQTITGDVRATGPHTAEGGRGRRTLIAGNGSVSLSVRTTSGDVRLRVVAGPRVPFTPAMPSARPFATAPVPAPVVPPPVAPAPPAAVVPPATTIASAGDDARPVTDDDTQAWSGLEPAIDRREAARLDVLRALERGEVDIETASRRLEALEDAGPRSFRGYC